MLGLAFALWLSWAPSVVAQTPCIGSPTETCVTALQNQSCAGTRFGGTLGCTANDVSSGVSFTQPAANTLASCVAGSDVVLDLVALIGKGAPARYDIGLFFGQTANDPQLNNVANLCSLAVTPTSSAFSAVFYNDPADGDACGDVTSGTVANPPGIPLQIQGVKVRCTPLAGSNKVVLPYLISWSQSTTNNGSFAACSAALVPGTVSKCSANIASSVTDIIVNAYINITKATVPAADPQGFSFTSTATSGTPAWTLAGISTTQTLTAGQTKQITVPLGAAGTNTMTITEALAPFWEPGVTISCTAGAGSGNPTVVNNATRVITATFTAANFGANCTITNTKKPRITMVKSIVARAVGTDQFTITATGGGTLTDDTGTSIVAPVTTTTSGVALSSSTSFRSSPATAITFTETAASGALSDYTTAYSCTNATPGSPTVMPTGATTTFNLTPAANDDITCTFTNTPKPVLTKAFSPVSIGISGTTTLTFTIANLAGAPLRSGITFTDAFPTNLVIAATPAVTNSCGGTPTITATAGNGTFTVGGTGVDSAAGVSTCTISVNLTSSVSGSYTNGAAQITATSSNLKNGVTNQTLGVGLLAPTTAKSFVLPSISVGGTTTMNIAVTNANAVALTTLAFTDT
ncbi:MAG: hypothetical protein H7232_13340, partial [Aeromicrobium sp.]|nr:hypothetical protein [Burkholderiales bacterium]